MKCAEWETFLQTMSTIDLLVANEDKSDDTLTWWVNGDNTVRLVSINPQAILSVGPCRAFRDALVGDVGLKTVAGELESELFIDGRWKRWRDKDSGDAVVVFILSPNNCKELPDGTLWSKVPRTPSPLTRQAVYGQAVKSDWWKKNWQPIVSVGVSVLASLIASSAATKNKK
jgi:hypothetical protein